MRKLFLWSFHVGLIPPAVILALKLQAQMPALLYIGIGHMILLSLLGSRLSPAFARLVVDSLHKAGFLHTLMALGAAVVASGIAFSKTSFELESLSLVLLPIGAALVPHVMGVWAGQAIEARHYDAVTRMEEAIYKLYREREEALRKQITSLTEQNRLLEHTTSNLREQARIANQSKEESKTLSTTIRDTKETWQRMREDVKGCAAGVRETTAVLRDTKKLHQTVIDLLESKLFRGDGV